MASTTILTFLRTAFRTKLLTDEIYSDLHTCIVVFQLLPDLARQYVMRLVAFPSQKQSKGKKPPAGKRPDIDSWVHDKNDKWHRYALGTLQDLHIIPRDRGKWLNAKFQNALQHSFCSKLKLPFKPSKAEKARASDRAERAYRKENLRWRSILKFLVDPNRRSSPHEQIREKTKELLISLGMVKVLGDHKTKVAVVFKGADPRSSSVRRLQPTSRGFEFLLKDVYHQIWYFLEQYIKSPANSPSDAATATASLPSGTSARQKQHAHQVFKLLCHLSYCEEGVKYIPKGSHALSDSLLDHFDSIGLIVKSKGSSFIVTSNGCRLIFGQPGSGRCGRPVDSGIGGMTLVVETNFRVIAFTQDPMVFDILKLFVDIKFCMKNMIMGELTKESVQRAIDFGISAQQIQDFLKQNADPRMQSRHKDIDILPENVVDQITLWESAKTVWKVEMERCVVVSHEVKDMQTYIRDKQLAEDLDILHAWDSESKKRGTLRLIIDSSNPVKFKKFRYRNVS